MNWDKLINTTRLGYGEDTGLEAVERYTVDDRVGPLLSAFQNDVDRVIFSSAFRRLQNKSQVYMMPESDYVRTRLTHSLEVASIGRLLSTTIFRRMVVERVQSKSCDDFYRFIAKSNETRGVHQADLVASITAACYAHDIGNAPFGHIGEYAIRSWFAERVASNRSRALGKLKKERPQHFNDFASFDGNPQAFRLITRNIAWKDRGGLQLCKTTVASTLKYVNSSTSTIDKKFGYFQSEKKIFEGLVQELGMLGANDEAVRHPFSYIVEAADDIAYSVSDIEDGVKMGRVSPQNAEDIFNSVLHDEVAPIRERLGYIGNIQGRIRYLGSAVVERLVRACSDVFVGNVDHIMSGNGLLDHSRKDHVGSLLEGCSPSITAFKARVKSECQSNIYPEPSKLRNEQGAYSQVHSLLYIFGGMAEEYIDALAKSSSGDGSFKDHMNEKFRNIFDIMTRGEVSNIGLDDYDVYRCVVDYVSGMTDRYAFNMYRNLQGVSLNMR